jgi:DNA (cytosine-5)-methyltransferase 1
VALPEQSVTEPGPAAGGAVTKPGSSIAASRNGRRRAPRLLDLYCSEGGAGAGYWLAGFDVVGVDHRPQPRYPFEFVQADVLEFLAAGGAEGFDVVHASPPCQLFTSLRALSLASGSMKPHLNLIPPTRAALRAWGGPYVIENVPGAPLEEPVRICGSSLGLDLRRHRLFESNVALMTPPCAHGWQTPRFEVRLGMPNSRSDGKDRKSALSAVVSVVGNSVIAAEARRAMGMPWATRDGCSQAIPPAYTQLLGGQLAHVAGVTKLAELARPGRRVEDLVHNVTKRATSEVVLVAHGLVAAVCSVCGDPFVRAATGRRRLTCGDRCRKALSRR